MNEENKTPACKPCEDCRKKELTSKEQEQAAGGILDRDRAQQCQKCIPRKQHRSTVNNAVLPDTDR